MTTDRQDSTTPAGGSGLAALREREWRHVLWEVSESGVFAITLNRPERLNALNFRMLREMHQLINYAHGAMDVRAITLRGTGTRAFCSGDDLKGMEPEPDIDNSRTVHHQLIAAIREIPKPVVALVHGFALGHGFELACACDLRLCADNIEVGDHRVTRALPLNGGSSWFLPRIIGSGRAAELLLTGRHMNGDEALAWGWANHVWSMDEFDERAGEYVALLARLPTSNLAVFKSSLAYSAGHGLGDSLNHELKVSDAGMVTEDATEGRRSFLEKRDPVFRGF